MKKILTIGGVILLAIILVVGYLFLTRTRPLSASPSTGVTPLEVTFVINPPGSIDGYFGGYFILDFGDGTTQESFNLGPTDYSTSTTHSYTKPGTYNTSLLELTGVGDMLVASTVVTVK